MVVGYTLIKIIRSPYGTLVKMFFCRVLGYRVYRTGIGFRT